MKLEAINVNKEFDNNIIIHNTNITFEKGKVYGFVGRNGSGKSVFLKMLAGFYYPTTGEILYNGVNYFKNGDFLPSLGIMIEKPTFLSEVSGFRNLKILSEIKKIIGDEEILETLKLVNLYEDRNKLYHKYSLGMKQKLAIAQVLMESPDIMIFDEPFNGIEDETADKLRKVIKELSKEKIIIVASHIKEDIEMMVDELYEVKNGKIEKKNII